MKQLNFLFKVLIITYYLIQLEPNPSPVVLIGESYL